MSASLRKILFLLFFVSGFCGLLYQVVWVRLAFASFGIISPVLSLVLSVFMLGLAIGSWCAGGVISWLRKRTNTSAIYCYAAAEFLIGVGAFAVPRLFAWGEQLLLPTGEMDSMYYLMLSAAVIVMSILPWCICMGATFPLMMAFVKEQPGNQTTSFSFLYLANVLGALCGTMITPLVLVELLGFSNTLLIAACGNFVVTTISLVIGKRNFAAEAQTHAAAGTEKSLPPQIPRVVGPAWIIPAILLTTGFSSMALEVVWTRAFTPILKTQVYSFASLLFTYLLATWIGSHLYRRHLARGKVKATSTLMAWLSLTAFVQIILEDPRWAFGELATLATIIPFCAILGYLTPKLVDEYSAGSPNRAGHAYAVNVIGCIVGPLVASYILLPMLGVKWSMIALTLPLVGLALLVPRDVRMASGTLTARWIMITACGLVACIFSCSYEERHEAAGAVVRRDHTATVISEGSGDKMIMLVNGIGITYLTPVTKMMAHLPLAFHEEKPESALVICFGMGTTYRSLLSWDVRTTAVELVPGVRDSFGYFYKDAEETMQNPLGRVVIDDGRRFLKRTQEKYDVITLDPPPPVEAAGSSLLYSAEFYNLVKQRLTDRGILHQWFPIGEAASFGAVVRSLQESFPHVKVFPSCEGWGFHFICSTQPLKTPSVETMLERMGEKGCRDLQELAGRRKIKDLITSTLTKEGLSPVARETVDKTLVAITDDRPYNEYYAIRRVMSRYRNGKVPLIR